MKFGKLAFLVGLVVVGSARPAFADDPPSFVKDVKPFLTKHCVSCHNSKNAKGGANLESFEAIMRGGKKNRVLLVPGKPDESRIVLTSEHKQKPVMPPKKSKQPEAAEITVLRAWVSAGAKDDTPKTGAPTPRSPGFSAFSFAAGNAVASELPAERPVEKWVRHFGSRVFPDNQTEPFINGLLDICATASGATSSRRNQKKE